MRYYFLRFPGGKWKALTLSYDDGCRYDIHLAEILDRYGIKATFNINGGWFGKDSNDWHLTVDEIKEHLLPGGHELAVHGQQHIAPGNVSPAAGITDVLECRRTLERTFGGIVRGMAYPDCGIRQIVGGASLEQIKSYLQMLGIAYARTLGGDNNRFEMPQDWYEWMPTCHHNNPDLMNYLNEFLAAKAPQYFSGAVPKLFYLWGHSYEFNNNNNWAVIEDFCKTAAHHPDIWYATNLEIYDYTCAYRSLRFNLDRTLVFNPSLYEVWFCADGKDYSVKPGETLKLD